MPSRLVAILAVLAAAATVAAGPAAATVATPATLATVLGHAAAGDVITLAPGRYDPLVVKNRHWSPPVTVEATAATLRAVRLYDVSGLTWHGGAFDGGDVERNGVGAQLSDHLVIDGVTFSHFVRNAVGLGTVSDARITNNTVSDSGSDGFDVALSRRIVLDHNRCTDFHPTPGAHPDCIQLWSRPEQPPTADITITNNDADGDMQGFTAFNHARPDASGKTVDDGGFDRITVEHNHARVTTYHGITLYDCRQCTVRHNRVESLPNPTAPRARAWIKLIASDDAVTCDNRAEGGGAAMGTGRCHDGN